MSCCTIVLKYLITSLIKYCLSLHVTVLEKLPSFNYLNFRLILQVKPHELKYEKPIKFKLDKIPSSLDSFLAYVAKIPPNRS